MVTRGVAGMNTRVCLLCEIVALGRPIRKLNVTLATTETVTYSGQATHLDNKFWHFPSYLRSQKLNLTDSWAIFIVGFH
jgi:hypothetical protein